MSKMKKKQNKNTKTKNKKKQNRKSNIIHEKLPKTSGILKSLKLEIFLNFKFLIMRES